MRSVSHRQRPPRRQLPTSGTRLLAIAAAFCVLALAIGACSLTAGAPSASSNSGVSSSGGSVTTGSGKSTTAKIVRGGGGAAMVLVPITIGGKGPYYFALDTGAGITLIDTDLANTLDLPVAGASGQVSGVGGTQDITPVRIDSWNAGDITLPSATVGKTGLSSFKQDSDVRGLLGSDILSRFGRITINYDSGQLSFSNTAEAQARATPASALDDAMLTEQLTDALREVRRPQAA